jgi:hypothetical protein
LICDQSNPVYSEYLARRFVDTTSELRIVNSLGVSLSGAQLEIGSYVAGSMGHRSSDVLVYFGMEEQASILLNALERAANQSDALGPPSSQDPLRIVFSDGALGEAFVERSRSVVARSANRFRIELLGPFDPRVPKGQGLSTEPNYSQYSTAARALAEHLVGEALDAGKTTNDGVSRDDILREMWKLQGSNLRFMFGGIECLFDENGDNKAAHFHVFRVSGSQLLHDESCPCSE